MIDVVHERREIPNPIRFHQHRLRCYVICGIDETQRGRQGLTGQPRPLHAKAGRDVKRGIDLRHHAIPINISGLFHSLAMFHRVRPECGWLSDL